MVELVVVFKQVLVRIRAKFLKKLQTINHYQYLRLYFAVVMFHCNRFLFPAPPSSYREESLKGDFYEVKFLDVDPPPCTPPSGLARFFLFRSCFARELPCYLMPQPRKEADAACRTLNSQAGGRGSSCFFSMATPRTCSMRLSCSQDSGIALHFLVPLYNALDYNIVALEYPGYGIYKSREISQETIEQDAEALMEEIVSHRKISPSDIVVFGRSMGTGPACFLATKWNLKGLVLMSPFASIRSVVKEHASVLSYLIKEKFENAKRAKKIQCPTLIIHGKSDKLINFSQSEAIFSSIENEKKMCKLPAEMTHNRFDFLHDIEIPLHQFLDSVESVALFQRQMNQQDSNITL